ncbi:MAG: tail fiber domain-containing protein [Bacteroidales bacterium]|jgi:hypothetical protein|nr:tail fiber domain-containing protein [Bacteroidales bacterium]
MKTNTPLFYLWSFIFGLFLSPAPLALSQIPQGFNYQAIARDGTGAVLSNTSLQVMFYVQSLSTGGTLYWKELHSTVTTNSFGLFNLVVGNGVRQTESTVATFDLIAWKVTPKYLKTEIYYSSAWHDLGTSQLMTVPYAMVAEDLAGSVTKLAVKGETSGLEEALFEVKNKDGQTVFAVYNEGVRVYVSNGAKAVKGGFAVGGFGTDKAESTKYLFVGKDSVRIYLDANPLTKGKKSGFAVGGYDLTKDTQVQNYLDVSSDSVRIYIDSNPATKKVKGGFAVGGYDMTKGTSTSNYMNVNTDASGIINPSQNRILWYPLKNAFLTGKVLVENKDSIGENSFSSGYESKAVGDWSQALGYRTIARGDYSTAIGYGSKASGLSSFAIGQGTVSSGNSSTVLGISSYARDYCAFAAGYRCEANGAYSLAVGWSSVAKWTGCVAIGVADTASTVSCTAIGHVCRATGYASTAIGYNAIASGSYSIAMGPDVQARGAESIAIGTNSKATGTRSIGLSGGRASGSNALAVGGCYAKGNASLASGYYPVAEGDASVAHGYYTVANSYASFVIGRCNDTSTCFSKTAWDSRDPVFIIGNGADRGHLSNAFTVYKNGNAYLQTGLQIANSSGPITANWWEFGVDNGGGTGIDFHSNTSAIDFSSRIYRTPGNNGDFQIVNVGTGGLDFQVNGANRLYLNSSGNVGIGTNAPSERLDIRGTIRNTTNTTYDVWIQGGAATSGSARNLALLGDIATDKLYLNYGGEYTGGTIIDGNVGVGTTTPGAKLDVVGDIRSSNKIWADLSGASASYFRGGNDAELWDVGVANTFGIYGVQNSAVATLRLGSGAADISGSGGNIGIGTLSPATKLHVSPGQVTLNGTDNPYLGLNNGTYQGYCEITSNVLALTYNGSVRLAVHATGNVGIATTLPSYKLQVNGSVAGVGAYVNTSDVRFKKDIEPITGALEKVMALQGIYFNWDRKTDSDFDFDNKKHLGFSAQDIEKVVPQVVFTANDKLQSKSIAYGDLVPLLAEAIKEQQQQIESTKQENQQLRSELQSLREEMQQIKGMLAKGAAR